MHAVIATITWARTPAEADLLYDSLSRLAVLGVPVLAADGGSDPAFLRRVAELENVSLVPYQRKEGARLISQVRAVLHAAANSEAPYVLYTEPDKGEFFSQRLLGFLRYGETQNGTGVVIAARNAESFSTFPAGQQLTEALTNQLLGETLGRLGDYLYGPLLIRSELIPYLKGVPEDLGWGWRIYLMAVAHRLGAGLTHHVAELPCPAAQRDEDDDASRLYRMEQMAQNVRGLALGLRTEL